MMDIGTLKRSLSSTCIAQSTASVTISSTAFALLMGMSLILNLLWLWVVGKSDAIGENQCTDTRSKHGGVIGGLNRGLLKNHRNRQRQLKNSSSMLGLQGGGTLSSICPVVVDLCVSGSASVCSRVWSAWTSSRAPLLTMGGTSLSDYVSLSVKPSSAYRDEDSS
ncbi:hypothetical protein Tco_0510461 [Tanacetum coccineum]